MALMRFTNNAEATTATLLRDSPDWDTYPDDEELANANYLGFEIGAADDPELFHYFSSEVPDGGVQPLTLTHSSLPGVYEVVYLNARSDRRFTVERRQEGTLAQTWPIGTKVSANVTAGMLRSLLQDDGQVARLNDRSSVALGAGYFERSSEAPVGSYSFLFRSRAKVDFLVQMGGYPAIQAHLAREVSDYGKRGGDQDLALAHEATGALAHVDIGEPPAWAGPRSYSHADVIVPSTPGGYQYWLNLDPSQGRGYYSFAEEPNFLDDGYNVAIYDGDEIDAGFVGNWEAQVMPVKQVAYFRFNAVLTEVGFIGRVNGTLTQAPTISVGTQANPTLFLNAVPLDQLTTAGQLCAQRIPIEAGGDLVDQLLFTVNQAGVGASIKGRFFWRAIFYSEE